MTTPPGLIEQSLQYRALGLATYGFVEARDVSVSTLESAILTARRYGPGADYTGAVYDRTGRLQDKLLRPMSGELDLRPVDPPDIDLATIEPGIDVDVGYYGGILFPFLGHFLVETLAWLWLWTDFGSRGRTRSERVRIVFHHWPGLQLADLLANRLYRALFRALGIKSTDIQLVEALPLRAGILHCPYPLSIYHHYMHPQMSRMFDHLAREVIAGGRESLRLPRILRPSVRRVFLSRSRWSENKRIRNEDQLDALFARHGFSILHPQELEPADLMELLVGAEVAASTDGSTAHLLAFCRPGTRMLTLDTRPVPTQFALDKLRGYRNFHVKLFDNGSLDPATGILDLSTELEAAIATVLRTDGF